MKKRFVLLAMTAVMSCSLVACGEKESSEKKDTTAKEDANKKSESVTVGNYNRVEIDGEDYYVGADGILTVDEVLKKCNIPDTTEYSGEYLSSEIFHNTVTYGDSMSIASNRAMYTLDGKCIYTGEDKEDPDWLWSYNQENVIGFNPEWIDLYIYTNDDYCRGIKNLKGDVLLKADFYRHISIGCCTADDIILLCQIDEDNNPYDAECDSDEMYDVVSLKAGKPVMKNLYIEDSLHDIYIGTIESNDCKDFVVELEDSEGNSTWYKNGKLAEESFNYDNVWIENIKDSEKYGSIRDGFKDYALYSDSETDTYTACYKGEVVGTYSDVSYCNASAVFGYYFVEYDNGDEKFYSFKTGEELKIPE